MRVSTTSVARACSRHVGLTFACWGAVLAGSVAALVLVLTGFTTEATGTNNPQSERAGDRLSAAFPPDPQRAVTDLVVVRSSRLTVDDAGFRSMVDGLVRSVRGSGAVVSANSYLDTNDGSLVSADRHATLIGMNIVDDVAAGDVIHAVERADATAEFDVAVTGARTRDHDFNLLSERDLLNGEVRFGLPAALLILLLVFGAIVAGLVPLVMALVAIVTALGLVALLTQFFELSIFTTNMLTGMGLALGIDYALFVISRYREERGYGRAGARRRDRRHRGDREPRSPVQRVGVCDRDVRPVDRALDNLPQPCRRRDPGRRHVAGRRADPPAGTARAAPRSRGCDSVAAGRPTR